MRSLITLGAAVAMAIGTAACSEADAPADDGAGEGDTLVLYTARHYDSDYALYEAFTEETGIDIEVVEADGDLLIERVKADGATNPPDVIVTVDAGRLWRAEQEGLFAPLESDVVSQSVPAGMRDPNGNWFGLASRARVIVYAEDRVEDGELEGYESLADPAFEGRICARSSGNIYNISLLAALIERWGEDRASDWASSVADNLARAPQGGDSDQIAAVAAGECDVAIVNHYYFARVAREDASSVDGLSIFWPQAGEGVHVNISGIGVAANARHPELAKRFIEFAVSPEAQRLFPELTNEYPAVEGTQYDNETLTGFGEFKRDPIAAGRLGANQQRAQQIFDRAGWP